MSLKFYAIRSRSSGLFLPSRAQWHKAYTSVELGESRPPRLFTTMSGAKNALRWWLEGTMEKIHWHENGIPFTDFKVTPQPERVADDMEIVTVVLTVQASPVRSTED